MSHSSKRCKRRDDEGVTADTQSCQRITGESSHRPFCPPEYIMTQVGRNDPCPCGSGKKYKRCCVGQRDVQSSSCGSFTPAERSSAIAKLWRFAASPEFAQDWEIAHAIFWGGILEDQDPGQVEKFMRLPQAEVMCNSWRVFDLEIEDTSTVIDLFLKSHASLLSPGERVYLDRAKTTFVGLYETEEVRLDEGLKLTDLWSGARVWVRERLATHNVVKWDLVAARLMEMPDGDWVMEAGLFQYPPRSKETLLKEMRRRHAAFQRQLPDADGVAIQKRMAPFLTHFWLDLVVFPPAPRVITPEGDKFVFAETVFDVTDPEELYKSLTACPELEQIEPSIFHWWEDAGPRRRSLGTVKLKDKRLTVETTSQQRAERTRSLLESIAGAAIRCRATAYQDVQQALKELERRMPGEPKETVPAEVAAQLTREFKEQHYRPWPDQPLPALGGRTPRRAARLQSQRSKLIALLKDMENREAHAAMDGRPAYDFTWIWKELGLKP